MCTPLVMWVIGISSSGRSGQTWDHMRRATWPCRWLTPLQYWDMRIARTNIDSGAFGPVPAAWPQASTCSSGRPRRRARGCSTGRTSSMGNSSCPAATGVWVVKTVVRGTISSAVLRSTP